MAERWITVSCTLPDHLSDLFAGLMSGMGVGGIVEEKIGERTMLVSYFDPKEFDRKNLNETMKAAISENVWMKDLEVIIEEKEVLDWQTAWRQHFKTFEIVPGIRVVPSWEADGGRTDENSIEMDPGMAFGTGLHETTRLCAEAIASLMADAWPRSLLDVGTGSGILAMIARRLGLTNIATVENDPVAREVAVQNFMKNSMGDITVARDIGAARGRFDIVVANILLSTILELRRELADKTATGGVLIVSGITSDQESDIEKAFCEGFRAISRKRQGEWSMIAFERGD